MAQREENERQVDGVTSSGLRRWLEKARTAVMKPWTSHQIQPDPSGVYQEQGVWDAEVQTIITNLGRIAEQAWNQVTGAPSVSRHAFVMAQLAQTENFLARIPDEVYNLVFAAITDAVNGGADTAGVAQRVDDVLSWAGSENWPSRAHVIAVTEVTRAMNAGALGAGVEMSRVTGRVLRKRWRTEHDDRVRASHRALDGVAVDIHHPFYVGGFPMMFPGAPEGPPDEVIGCRCDLIIENEEG